MHPILQHAIERVERPGGSHEGVGRKKGRSTRCLHVTEKRMQLEIVLHLGEKINQSRASGGPLGRPS